MIRLRSTIWRPRSLGLTWLALAAATIVCLGSPTAGAAPPEPVATLVPSTSAERPATQLIDIWYDAGALQGAGAADSVWIALEASADGGANWDLPVFSVAGDLVRKGPGAGHIVWFAGADITGAQPPMPGVRVLASSSPSVPTGHDMIRVPAGGFLMGTDTGDAQEGPMHTVLLDAFWIDRFETTNRGFQRFVQSTGHQTVAEAQGTSLFYRDGGYHTVAGASWWRPTGPGSDLMTRLDHPVVQIAWDDAVAYCRWLGKRLPTEAEWERAARGTDGRTFAWGEAGSHGPLPRANAGAENCCHESAHDGFLNTAPVGSFPQGVSPVGAHDMAGNVWEWTADRFARFFYRDSARRNPRGPATGAERVLRGGSWISYPFMLRAAYRGHHTPETRHNYSGFRCASDAEPD